MDVGSPLTWPTEPVIIQQLRYGSHLEALVPQRQQAKVGALLPGWSEMQVEAERSRESQDCSEPSVQTKQRCGEQGLIAALGKTRDAGRMTNAQKDDSVTYIQDENEPTGVNHLLRVNSFLLLSEILNFPREQVQRQEVSSSRPTGLDGRCLVDRRGW
jgi:hypothetical protein